MKELSRTKQGQFTLEEHTLHEEQWTLEHVLRSLQPCPEQGGPAEGGPAEGEPADGGPAEGAPAQRGPAEGPPDGTKG